MARAAKGSNTKAKKRSFHQELVLNRWVLGFFQGGTLAALKMRLGDDRFETGAEPFRDFEADDLNKIAFWNATGSGKTLLLHVNIRQYLCTTSRRAAVDKCAITIPNAQGC
jgi:hypothetical protein